MTAAPRTASRRRSVLAWVAIGAAVLVFGAVIALFDRQWAERPPLDPEGPGPEGARAITRILGEHGVEVVAAHRRDEALAALGDDAVLVIADPAPLSDDALRELAESAAETVILEPRTATVALFAPDAAHAGFGEAPTDPGCDLPAAVRAGAILPAQAFRAPGADVLCYPVADGHALIGIDRAETRVWLLDGAELVDNAHLAEGGNAALGLGLIGSPERVVWYVPSLEDADAAAPPTLGQLMPPWLTPAVALLLAAGLAAAVWRGRRFGPLVAERLPVTVRGSETLEGRARLYARTGDAAHAADLVRGGAVTRMAARLGLSPSAAAEEVADAAAARLGVPAERTRAILLVRPATDAALAEAAARWRDLEDAIDAATGRAAGSGS